MRFKTFLEAAATERQGARKIDTVSMEAAADILNEHCANALWMRNLKRPIWRGEMDGTLPRALDVSGFAVTDTSATVRRSENTSNYYTLIFDNIPSREHLPKRSRSYIATTNRHAASDYADNEPFIIIPYDTTPIGVVNKDDMWATSIKFLGATNLVEELNGFFASLELKDNQWSSFVNFDRLLKSGDEAAIDRLRVAVDDAAVIGLSLQKNSHTAFMEQLDVAYSARATGHAAATTATLKRSGETEVWVSGKVVLISLSMWERLVKNPPSKTEW